MTHYCEASQRNPLHKHYHDHEYGRAITDDNQLFERLSLEINQAGLSWLTILKKREGFYEAFQGFDLERVAAFDAAKIEHLITNPNIIRNRLKINSVIENARRILALPQGSFLTWLEAHQPLPLNDWVKLFKQNFKFTGPQIVNEFLMSIGFLPGAHHEKCPCYHEIIELNPNWLKSV
jgi:DNA-3-methyladenine glycosylase I